MIKNFHLQIYFQNQVCHVWMLHTPTWISHFVTNAHAHGHWAARASTIALVVLFIDFVQLASNVDAVSPLWVCSEAVPSWAWCAFTNCASLWFTMSYWTFKACLVGSVPPPAMYFTTEPSCVSIFYIVGKTFIGINCTSILNSFTCNSAVVATFLLI